MSDCDVRAAAGLEDVLTAEQARLLAEKLQAVVTHGYGEIRITVDHGHVRLIQAMTSHVLPFTDVPGGEVKRRS